MASTHRKALATFLIALLSGVAASAASKNPILGIDVSAAGEGRVVRIRTTSEPTFTVFRLSDPMRVVVDISGGDLSKLEVPIAVEDGVVDQIAGRQFASEGFMIGRLIVGFVKNLTYDVQAEGKSVVVRTSPAPGATVTEAAPPPIAPVNRVAHERFETARKEADQAAARAALERQRAEAAAVSAREQQSQAEKIAREAERLKSEAEKAKAEADTLRRQANEAIAKDRARARRDRQRGGGQGHRAAARGSGRGPLARRRRAAGGRGRAQAPRGRRDGRPRRSQAQGAGRRARGAIGSGAAGKARGGERPGARPGRQGRGRAGAGEGRDGAPGRREGARRDRFQAQ